MWTRSLLLALALAAQFIIPTNPDTNPIAPWRRIDWSQAGAGTIPARLTQCVTAACNTVVTGPPSSITAAQINAAIASAAATSEAAATFVSLPAGTYTLSAPIDFAQSSFVTLRGAGPSLTKVLFSGANAPGCSLTGNSDVCIEGSFNWNGGPQNSTTWTAGFSQGATQITLGSTAGLSVGQLLILDQANDLLDTNNVFVCDNTVNDGSHTGCSTDPGLTCGTVGGAPARLVGGICHGQQQYVKVTGISGNNVTFTPGLYMPNWSSSKSPGAWWANTLIQRSGVESMSFDHTNSGSTTQNPPTQILLQQAIIIDNAYNCWVKNVRDVEARPPTNTLRNHISLQYAAHISIVNSYFYGTAAESALSYGIEQFQAGDIKVENCLFKAIVSPMLTGNGEGLVFAYNYTTDDHFSLATWMMAGEWMHDCCAEYILYEGNSGAGFIADDIHGSHNFITVYRNYYSGLEPGKTQQTVPINLNSHARFFNVLGNVLGTSTYHTVYEVATPTSANCDVTIFRLGQSADTGGGCTSDAVVPSDTLVKTTLFRWGNYDTVNGSVQFNNNEVPVNYINFPNPLPPTHNLPYSQYLTSRPSWWPNTIPWPPIGPDVTGGNITGVGGFANKPPAQVCYESLSDDPAYTAGTVRTYVTGSGSCNW